LNICIHTKNKTIGNNKRNYEKKEEKKKEEKKRRNKRREQSKRKPEERYKMNKRSCGIEEFEEMKKN